MYRHGSIPGRRRHDHACAGALSHACGNDSNLLAGEGRFGREVGRALKRLRAAQRACAMSGLVPPGSGALRRGVHLLQLRAASLRLQPADHPLPGDTRLAALTDAILLPFRVSFEPLSRRLVISGYSRLS